MLQRNYQDLVHPDQVVNSPRAGNHADPNLCKPHICCAWMDLHEDTDYGVTKEDPLFFIKVKFWDEDAFLVVTDDDDRLVILERTGDMIVFNGTKHHGLVTETVARELVERQDEEGPAYKTFVELTMDGQFAPKMVWDWITDTEQQKEHLARSQPHKTQRSLMERGS